MLIYKILRSNEWAALQAHGETHGAPVDIADGYVHFSTAAQAPETASKWFAAMENLQLLAFDSATLGAALKWEPSRGGQLFPHLYGSLKLQDMIWHAALPWDGAAHVFPEGMA